MTVEKPKPKQLLRPITTGADSVMNQSQFLAVRDRSFFTRYGGLVGFGRGHPKKNGLKGGVIYKK